LIENTYRLLNEEKMPLPRATLHGAAEIAVPTLVSTLAISCVFTSVVFLDGPAKYLFTPLGLAVVFAMLASYVLSRTLTPITNRPDAEGPAASRRPAGRRRLRPVPRLVRARLRADAQQPRRTAPDPASSLLFAAPTTLLVVPYLFAMLRTGNDGKAAHGVFTEVLE
jgi:hypothetical protein